MTPNIITEAELAAGINELIAELKARVAAIQRGTRHAMVRGPHGTATDYTDEHRAYLERTIATLRAGLVELGLPSEA